jgi:3-deoxy-D-manno-octulosonate 8-phosphate phosphatase (KDO 8-P phosphatase)
MYLIVDVDGTLTDGKLNYTQDGQLFQSFHVRDGGAMHEIVGLGYKVIVLSGRSVEFVKSRYKGFNGVEFYGFVNDKVSFLSKYLNINFDEVRCCAVGDDINDIELFKRVNFSFAVSDSVRELSNMATHKLATRGGNGVLSEVLDFLRDLKVK